MSQSRNEQIAKLSARLEEATKLADAFDALADEIAALTVPKQCWTPIWQGIVDRLRADSKAADRQVQELVDHRRLLLAANEAADRYTPPAQDSSD